MNENFSLVLLPTLNYEIFCSFLVFEFLASLIYKTGPSTNPSHGKSSCFLQGSKSTLPSSILNTQFRCSHSQNMKRMREDDTVIPPFCKRTT